ncbi:hypothetical protein [Paenibacillus sp. USHLN196]|jgi:hypothetical protein|uniref:hypothetical protein n=1 Tax=Paenibacillus sp. USHLN196 TaxID=3081291 RepID=UPI0015C451B7
MQNETLLMLAVIAAGLQVIIQLLGALKAFLEWLTVRDKRKGSNRSQRLRTKKNRKPK